MTFSVAFAGTPGFAATALAALVAAGFAVPLVLTRPDRPRGRGLKVGPSPVKTLAEDRGIFVLQPGSLKTDEARAPIVSLPVDVLVVAAYGLILPAPILEWPRHGCINIHASLLPRWRGAAPVQRAILAGDAVTGITIMQMDQGLDTGPIVDATEVPIADGDTSGTLTERLAVAGGQAIVAALSRLEREGSLGSRPQPRDGATYARKIERAEAAIDWESDADTIDRQVRAFEPSPGAFTSLEGVPIKILRARAIVHPAASAPGTVLEARSEGIDVACGRGALRIFDLQPAGKRRMKAEAFLAGHYLPAGARFAPTPASPLAPPPGTA
jgi:methionyl-tRNA formyltransferase